MHATQGNGGIDSRWLRWCLTGVVVLLAVIAVELSALIGPIIPRAEGQIPDSGAQLQQLIAAQEQSNRILQQILDHLKTGEIKVATPTTDKDNKSAAAPRPGRPTTRAQQPPRTK